MKRQKNKILEYDRQVYKRDFSGISLELRPISTRGKCKKKRMAIGNIFAKSQHLMYGLKLTLGNTFHSRRNLVFLLHTWTRNQIARLGIHCSNLNCQAITNCWIYLVYIERNLVQSNTFQFCMYILTALIPEPSAIFTSTNNEQQREKRTKRGRRLTTSLRRWRTI